MWVSLQSGQEKVLVGNVKGEGQYQGLLGRGDYRRRGVNRPRLKGGSDNLSGEKCMGYNHKKRQT